MRQNETIIRLFLAASEGLALWSVQGCGGKEAKARDSTVHKDLDDLIKAAKMYGVLSMLTQQSQNSPYPQRDLLLIGSPYEES